MHYGKFSLEGLQCFQPVLSRCGCGSRLIPILSFLPSFFASLDKSIPNVKYRPF